MTTPFEFDYDFQSPQSPDMDGLDVALSAKRDRFWHPLLFLLDDTETVTAYRTSSDETSVLYKRTALNTRLSKYRGPAKFDVRGDSLYVELYTDTYSYIQPDHLKGSIDKYPLDTKRISWPSSNYWAVATSVTVLKLQCPPASNMCWMPETNVHQHIRNEVLSPDDPPNPLTNLSLGVSTSTTLPSSRDQESLYNLQLQLFLDSNYTDKSVPLMPTAPPVGAPVPGTWQPVLSSDGFYFISWQYIPAVPTPTPTPTPG